MLGTTSTESDQRFALKGAVKDKPRALASRRRGKLPTGHGES